MPIFIFAGGGEEGGLRSWTHGKFYAFQVTALFLRRGQGPRVPTYMAPLTVALKTWGRNSARKGFCRVYKKPIAQKVEEKATKNPEESEEVFRRQRWQSDRVETKHPWSLLVGGKTRKVGETLQRSGEEKGFYTKYINLTDCFLNMQHLSVSEQPKV